MLGCGGNCGINLSETLKHEVVYHTFWAGTVAQLVTEDAAETWGGFETRTQHSVVWFD